MNTQNCKQKLLDAVANAVATNKHLSNQELSLAITRLALQAAADLARQHISDPEDLQLSFEATKKGELYFGGHYLPYDNMAWCIASDIETIMPD